MGQSKGKGEDIPITPCLVYSVRKLSEGAGLRGGTQALTYCMTSNPVGINIRDASLHSA